MKGYYSSSASSSIGSPNLNLRNDCVSPINSPNESILMRYLRSGSSSDHDYSPSRNTSRSIVSRSSISSRSPLSGLENLEEDVLVMDEILVDSNKISKSADKELNANAAGKEGWWRGTEKMQSERNRIEERDWEDNGGNSGGFGGVCEGMAAVAVFWWWSRIWVGGGLVDESHRLIV